MNDYETRVVADIRDRIGWAKVRSRGIGASDAAKFAKVESAPLYARNKLYSPFDGNGYTRHGHEREPLMLAAFHTPQNFAMFRASENPRHLATPDGIKVGGDGSLLLVQCKTTNKAFRTIPRDYLRQMWWEQYVLGAERTLFVWEQHDGFRPVTPEPESRVIDRDDEEIRKLIQIADAVLGILDRGDAHRIEMEARRG
jgi:hypothetical protein